MILWARQVGRVGEKTDSYRVVVGKPQGERCASVLLANIQFDIEYIG